MGRLSLLDRRHGWLRQDAEYDSIQGVMDLLDDYDQATRALEDRMIERINRNLDRSFRELARRLRRIYARELAIRDEGGPVNERAPERTAEILKRLRALLVRLNPAKEAAYRRMFKELLAQANALGLEYGERLVATQYQGDDFLPQTVAIPMKAVAEAARSATQYLDWSKDYGRDSGTGLAGRISDIVQQGLINGDGPAVVARRLAVLGGVVKRRAAMVARTETHKAAVAAQMRVYEANGVKYGAWLATVDERTCQHCAPLMGAIFRLSDLYVRDRRGWVFQVPPAHPNCRCALAAVTLTGLAADPEQLDEYQQLHRDTMERLGPVGPATGPPPFLKSAGRTLPSPVWEPGRGVWLDPVAAARFNQFKQEIDRDG